MRSGRLDSATLNLYSNSTGGTINPEGLVLGCCLGWLGRDRERSLEPELRLVRAVVDRLLRELLPELRLPELARVLLLPLRDRLPELLDVVDEVLDAVDGALEGAGWRAAMLSSIAR